MPKRVEGIKRYWKNNPEAKVEKNKKISEGVKNSTVVKWTPALRAKACASQKEAAKTRQHSGAILWKEKGLKHPQFKELVQYDLEGNLINIFYKAEELIPVFGKRLMVGQCCRKGGQLSIKGFIFRYLYPDLDIHLPNTKESIQETVIKINKPHEWRKTQKQKDQYDTDPKTCTKCSKKISYEKRKNNFCNRSCSTSFHNDLRKTHLLNI